MDENGDQCLKRPSEVLERTQNSLNWITPNRVVKGRPLPPLSVATSNGINAVAGFTNILLICNGYILQ